MTTVCVTGGAGYLASWLVMRLLQRGYTVHVTSRNLTQGNVVALKNLPGAEAQLRLFEADLYDQDAVLQAIQGCQYVIHMATPFVRTLTRFKDTAEAAIAGIKCIVEACVKSGTAKRIVYTGSIVACSPLKDVANSLYRDSIDESCWTPIDTNFPFADGNFLLDLLEYVKSKTVAEKELLKYNESGEIEVVSLTTGLVGGDTLHSSFSGSLRVLLNICIYTFRPLMQTLLSQFRGDEADYNTLKFIEELVGKIPIVHIEDACKAHIYCMENSSISGRLLCANGYLKTVEISESLKKHCPSIDILQRFIVDTERTISWGSTKLQDAGFQYEYDADATIKYSIKCAIRLGEVTLP